MISITLSVSGIELKFEKTPNTSLLTVLENQHIKIDYQCREGYCGACRTRIISGKVIWLNHPLAFLHPGEILLCCCRTDGHINLEI